MDGFPATGRRHPALLLLGPTGAGKTPLGYLLETRGLWRQKYLHFDFGENLRTVVSRNKPDESITAGDIEFLRGVLSSGALLEDEHFPLAKRLLHSFLLRRRHDGQACIVLNGLPRHVGQARALDSILDVRVVVCLECSTETVLRRIESDIGGDRGGRQDDEIDALRKRLEIFHQRTSPLVAYYRRRGVRNVTIPVMPSTTPEEMWDVLSATES